MTIGGALSELNNLLKADDIPCYYKPSIKAVMDTIALEQEPTTNNDLGVDCISRAELLKAMDTWDKFGNAPNIGLITLRTPALQDRYVPYVKYNDMVNCVKGMPSITPQEPRKGHWISHREHCESIGAIPSGLGAYAWCSNCDCAIDIRAWGRNHYNYCPNCGANMREVVEECQEKKQ